MGGEAPAARAGTAGRGAPPRASKAEASHAACAAAQSHELPLTRCTAACHARVVCVCVARMRVVDLFAGLGGFTCGALEAGANVILAVDSDPTPLKLLGANSTNTTTVVATLGPDRNEVELPPAAADLHLHLSTPCQELSIARRGPVSSGGLAMLRWAIELVLARGDCSWSLENVPTRPVRTLMAELATAHPEQVSWAVFDSADFGAGQSRARVIAGPPKLIRMLQSIPCARRISVRDAFANAGVDELPARYLKNQTRSSTGSGAPTMRPVEAQSFTVCAGHGLTWCDADGKTARVMTARDSAILQGFPMAWRLPHGSRAAQTAVGNAICVCLSKAIVLAAMAVRRGEAGVPIEAIVGMGAAPTPSELPSTPPAEAKEKTKMTKRTLVVSFEKHRRLRQRVVRLEEVVAELQTTAKRFLEDNRNRRRGDASPQE